MNDQSLKPAELASRSVAQPPVTKRPRRLLMPLLTLLVFALAIAGWAGRWYLHQLAYVDETNARVVSEVTALSSRVAGWVVKMNITEGTRVTRDQVLVRVDDRRSRMRQEELSLEHAALRSEGTRVVAEIAMVDARTQSRYASEKSKLDAARALSESFSHELRYANDEYKRAQSLAKRGVIATRALDQARTAYLRAQQAQLRSRAQVASAEAELREAESARREINVLEADKSRIDHRAKAVEVQIERQALDIADRAIHSPLNGVVSRTFVSVGEYVTPGQRIALLHDPKDIWIEALIKETQFRRVQVGQSVEVSVDAYPDETFVVSAPFTSVVPGSTVSSNSSPLMR